MLKLIRNEKGVALMVSLMVLIMLTLIGMAAILNTTTEINIASNQKQGTQALYLAEAGANVVKAYFENPAAFTATNPTNNVACLNKDDGTIAAANCTMANHSSVNAGDTWPASFFDKRREDGDGAPSYIQGAGWSQFLDINNGDDAESNNGFDDGVAAMDANGGVTGDTPAMQITNEAYINNTVLGGAFNDIGTVRSIEIFPPFQPTNYAVVRVVAEVGGSVRTIEQEIGPSIFIPITSGAQTGGLGSWSGSGTVHWGKVKVEGDLDQFNANNSPSNQLCADNPGSCPGTLEDEFDEWFEVKVGGSVLSDQGSPDACVTDCPNAEVGADRKYEYFDVYENVPGVEIDVLDYDELKSYAQDSGTYYVVCVDGAGGTPPPDVGQNDAVFHRGSCDDAAPQTFEELTNQQSFDLYFVDWEDTTGTNTTAKGPGFTLQQTGNYWTDGNLYINGNVDWGGSGGGKDTVMEDPDGYDNELGLSCAGLADQSTCTAGVNIDGLLYTTGEFSGNGSPVIYGALVAEGGLTSSGTPDIYYDSAYENGIGNLPRTSRQIWRELR